VRDRGRFVWGLSGGATPAMLYRLLTEERDAARMPWEETFVFWGDERWVPSDHPDSNQRMARAELLDKVPIPPRNIRPIVTIGLEPHDSAAAADRQVRTLFDKGPHADLILLGLGDDGHTASLFPGTAGLIELSSLFTANYVPMLQSWRITATYSLLNAARHVAFLVAGSMKATAVRQVLYPIADTMVLPASMVKPSDGKLTWLLDREAAALMPHAD
jgi:6-phosphogluconolactonase